MSNSKDLPIGDSSIGENPDERVNNEHAASRPPKMFDAPPLSPGESYANDSARTQDGDRALTRVAGSQVPMVVDSPPLSTGESYKLDSPRAEAARIAHRLQSGHSDIIEACVRFSKAVTRFESDEPALNEFLAELVSQRVLTEAEFQHGISCPKASEMRAIGNLAYALRLELGFGRDSKS